MAVKDDTDIDDTQLIPTIRAHAISRQKLHCTHWINVHWYWRGMYLSDFNASRSTRGFTRPLLLFALTKEADEGRAVGTQYALMEMR
jgi:hypothetical protein